MTRFVPRPARFRARVAALLSVASAMSACDQPDPAPTQPSQASAAATAAAASAALEAAKKAAAEKAAAQVIRRPKDAAELLLNPARRAKLESANPDAKGFLDLHALEEKLFKKELKRGANDDAAKAFDQLAKGRYVFFAGNIMNPEPDSFQLAVRYTPREATDPMGLTSSWFPVTFKAVKGYDAKQYRAGEPAGILAKYDGKQTASNGVDVVLLQQWDFSDAK